MEVCPWCTGSALYREYHDREWGVPLHDDRALFELLTLEGAQAGLSWATILKKRENYRRAFDGFDPPTVARYGDEKVAALLALTAEGTSFAGFLWQFVGHQPIVNRWESLGAVPARSAQSDAMSRALLHAGFKFVGSTICYAFMQACGMVNDHLTSCPRHAEVSRAEGSGER